MKKGLRKKAVAAIIIPCLLLATGFFSYAEEALPEKASETVRETINTDNNNSDQLKVEEERTDQSVSMDDEKTDSSSEQNNVDENQLHDSPELIVKEVTAGIEYDAYLLNIAQSDYDYIVMKVWSNQDEEDEPLLYPAEWQEEKKDEINTPSFLAHISLANYKHSMTYQIAAYGIEESDKHVIKAPENITVEMLSIEEVSTEIIKTSFDASMLEVEDVIMPSEDAADPSEEVSQAPIGSGALKSALEPSGPIKGIDVSKHNGVIDWSKVKAAGIRYAIIRCGYGDNITSQDDARWSYNVSQCEKLGIPYGVYIYSYATNTTMAKSEAEHCIRLLKGHSPQYPVYLDLEDEDQATLSNATLKSITVTWATKILSAGYKPGVYSSKYWWTNKLTSSDYNNYSKWVAQWNSSCTYAGTYQMWQYSSTGSVNGIAGNVDMDYWYGGSNISPGSAGSGGSSGEGEEYGSGPGYGVYEIVSAVNNNYAIDIYGASKADKANVHLYKRNGTGAQKFWVVPLGYDNQYCIINHTSGKYLDVAGDGSANMTNIWQYAENNTQAQKFHIYKTSSGEYEIQGVSSGKYVDLNGAKAANGTNIQIYTSNHTAAQKWKLVPTKDDMPDRSVYEIVSSINRNYALDIYGASKANKANVHIYNRNKTAAQQFTFVPVGRNNMYYIRNRGSGKNLDVTGNGKTDRTNVWQYTPNSTQAQMFQLIPIAGGSFEIRGVASGKNLDVNGAIAANGTNVQIYTSNGTAAQRWYFVKVK